MDSGTAIIIAALVPTASSLINEWRSTRRAKWIAQQLEEHNKEVAVKLAENTALTAQTKVKMEETSREMNGILEARLAAEKAASEARGLALGIIEGKALAEAEPKKK